MIRKQTRLIKAFALFGVVAAWGCGGEPVQDDPPQSVSWSEEVAPVLLQDCGGAGCHYDRSHTFTIGDGCSKDHAAAVEHVDVDAPEDSLLLVKGGNTDGKHVGGTQLEAGEYGLVLAWIRDGAVKDCEVGR